MSAASIALYAFTQAAPQLGGGLCAGALHAQQPSLLWQKNTLGRIRIPKLEISIQPNGCKEFETVKCALILKSPDS